jgi:hypothetical protein
MDMLRREWLLELSVHLGVGLRDFFWGWGTVAMMVRYRVRRIIDFHVLEALSQSWFAVLGFSSNFNVRRV